MAKQFRPAHNTGWCILRPNMKVWDKGGVRNKKAQAIEYFIGKQQGVWEQYEIRGWKCRRVRIELEPLDI